MGSNKQSEREQRYREAQAERGFVHVRVWVPDNGSDAVIKQMAAQMREEYRRGK